MRRWPLPVSIDVGDYVGLISIGAYSLSGRSDFNGFDAYSLFSIGD